ELAQAVLSNVLYNPKKRLVTPEKIARAVSEYYGVDMEALRGQKRDKSIVVPRQIAMFLMRCCGSVPSSAVATTPPSSTPATRSIARSPSTTTCGATWPPSAS
ncbi:MAG: chromosomal replication initiator protein DnaA, partial [Chloroflexi bacterium]|nr:chromosomal replication initiator protein DnaA [Chloroflexota bacterium]